MKRFLISLALSLVAVAALAQNAPPRIDNISPRTAPTSGGVDVTITGANFETKIVCILPCPTTVTFGDVKVEPSRLTDTELVVKAPAHAAGTVDVTVTTGGGGSATAHDAFTFTDSPLNASWEPVLLPVYIDGATPGAGGSQWKTDLWIYNDGAADLAIAPWPCPGDQVCPAVFPLTKTLRKGEAQHNLAPFFVTPSALPGRLIYFNRGSADNASVNLRVVDSARATLDPGTEVPVVRERELLSKPVSLLNVPLGNNRLLLRVYDVALTDAQFHVRVFTQTDVAATQPLSEFDLHATTNESGDLRTRPAYAQFELPVPALAAADGIAVRVEITPLTSGSRYWAFVSATNNATSHVTTITPQ